MESSKKPKFTEVEIDELCEMYKIYGMEFISSELLKKFQEIHKLSDIHIHVITLRKIINETIKEQNEKIKKDFPNSALSNKILERFDFHQNNKIKVFKCRYSSNINHKGLESHVDGKDIIDAIKNRNPFAILVYIKDENGKEYFCKQHNKLDENGYTLYYWVDKEKNVLYDELK